MRERMIPLLDRLDYLLEYGETEGVAVEFERLEAEGRGVDVFADERA